MTVAFVTGITGQDGSYLVEQLLSTGTEVHGVVRDADPLTGGLAARHPEVTIHVMDLRDGPGIAGLVEAVAPDEVYHLGGVSSVAQSWADPVLTMEVTGVSAAYLLDACWKRCLDGHDTRFLQASSAEIFGDSPAPQSEGTPVRPRSPYGVAKALAHHLVGVYRDRGMFSVSLILYNHESPRRPPSFVTRKITKTVAEIAAGLETELVLGNLDARRDWGWAPDYVDAMVRAMRHHTPHDYVISTGILHSVLDFVEEAFRAVGMDDWEGFVRSDPDLLRPTDPGALVGDSAFARAELGWVPASGFSDIVHRMVESDQRDISP